MTESLTLRINGRERVVEVPTHRSLLDVLRLDLLLLGTKKGCETGCCGACTVLVDGEPACSCLLLPHTVAGREIRTIEGLARDGVLDPVQEAFVTREGFQCGYCTPGMILSAWALLRRTAAPSEEEIRHALVGNLCRCTGYVRIVEAVQEAAARLGDAKGEGR